MYKDVLPSYEIDVLNYHFWAGASSRLEPRLSGVCAREVYRFAASCHFHGLAGGAAAVQSPHECTSARRTHQKKRASCAQHPHLALYVSRQTLPPNNASTTRPLSFPLRRPSCASFRLPRPCLGPQVLRNAMDTADTLDTTHARSPGPVSMLSVPCGAEQIAQATAHHLRPSPRLPEYRTRTGRCATTS